MGSNHRPLACKAEYGQEYAQLTGPVHALDLRKQCLEMPSGARESLHGGSRKWFPEQSADHSLLERVEARGRATGVAPAGWPGLPYELRWTGGQAGGDPPNSGLAPGRGPVASGFSAPKHPDTLRTREQLSCLTSRPNGRPTPREHRPSRRVTGATKDSADQLRTQ